MTEFVSNNAVWIAPALSAIILVLQVAQAKIAALTGTAAPKLTDKNEV